MTDARRRVARYGWRPDLPTIATTSTARSWTASRACRCRTRSTSARACRLCLIRASSAAARPTRFAARWASCTPASSARALQLYYDERVIEGDVSQDDGAQIRDGVKVLNQTGVGPEADWPYVEAKFAHKPPAKELKEAAQHKVTTYERLTTRAGFRQCLAAGFPFVIGFTAYESFESDAVAKSGVVPMPGKPEQVVGGHAVCVIGYDVNAPGGDSYFVRNSWGADWGLGGDFWMPAAYFENDNLADDAWTLRA